MSFSFRKISGDVTAGLTVSFAAISLGAAFGVMSGRGAMAGMIGAAVIPIIASIFGGTRLQASGPTAPMTAVSALIIAFAYDSFPDSTLAEQFITLVFLLNAVFLVIGGFLRLGRLITYVPNVVILGFMNGIAVLIWMDQFKKLLALSGKEAMEGGVIANLGMALATFLLIFVIVWAVKRLPVKHHIKSLISGVLFSIIIMTVLSVVVGMNIERISLDGAASSMGAVFSSIRNYFPSGDILTQEYILMAIPYAAELALLAYLDSLLTALVVDRMTRERSNLNKELIAQGLANGVSGICQGIPGAQATIRSVLLIKEGAQSRLAGVLIGVFALLSIGIFKNYLTLVPAAVFAGVLLKAGLDVCDKDFLREYFIGQWFKSAQRNVQLVFIAYTTIITVVVNLNVAVITGTALFYLLRVFWKFKDVEADLEEISYQEAKTITG